MRSKSRRLGLSWVLAMSATAAVSGCASQSAAGPAPAPKSSSHEVIAVGIIGGDYRWTPPIVRPASSPDARPEVLAGKGPDPVSGSVLEPIVEGTGPALTDPARARIRYIQQSWDGSTVVHDSWQNSGSSEPVPTDAVGARISLALARAHIGDLYELVLSTRSAAAVNGQSAVLAVLVTGQ